jgi:hypothetical protein
VQGEGGIVAEREDRDQDGRVKGLEEMARGLEELVRSLEKME